MLLIIEHLFFTALSDSYDFFASNVLIKMIFDVWTISSAGLANNISKQGL